MFVSMQCSESQSGEKFKQTRVNNGSIYDSLKVTGCECQSDVNLKHTLLLLRFGSETTWRSTRCSSGSSGAASSWRQRSSS